MKLTDLQIDALTELLNIAFSRSAASLSELTNNRVELAVPEVSVHELSTIAASVSRFVSGEIATVHQVFAGPVAGDAFLLLNFNGAVQLVELITNGEVLAKGLGASAREIITEIGNIVMNACLGVFGNLLKVNFSYSVPRMSLDDLSTMIDSLVLEKSTHSYGLVVGARFHLRESEITGCLMLVLGLASLELFLQEVEAWAERSMNGDEV